MCGSCWAFAATGGMEGAYMKAFGSLLSFSEQQLLDCVKKCDDCDGGYTEYAYEYDIDHFIGTEKQYPYFAF
jgi:C1A family cysteine protease